MDEPNAASLSGLPSDAAKINEAKDDHSEARNEPNDTISGSSVNNQTMPEKDGEEKESGGDKKVLEDGTEADGDQDSKDNVNTDSSDQKDETTVTSSVPEQDVLLVDENAVEKLTAGFLQTFLPHTECSNASLDELMRNQRVLIETLEQENAKFKENKMMSDLSELMTEAKKYHSKLVHLRKEMMSLHEKSTKLKKRALKLQHHKMKQNLQKEQQRERELEQEKHLIAKPAAKKTP